MFVFVCGVFVYIFMCLCACVNTYVNPCRVIKSSFTAFHFICWGKVPSSYWVCSRNLLSLPPKNWNYRLPPGLPPYYIGRFWGIQTLTLGFHGKHLLHWDISLASFHFILTLWYAGARECAHRLTYALPLVWESEDNFLGFYFLVPLKPGDQTQVIGFYMNHCLCPLSHLASPALLSCSKYIYKLNDYHVCFFLIWNLHRLTW